MMPILKPVKSRYFIKWLNPKFFEAAADIECNSGERLWTEEIIRRCMKCHGCSGHVIVDLKKPVGYMVYKLHPKECRVNLMNAVVLPEYRRQGLGTLLLDNLRRRMIKYPAKVITTCVRETNSMAHGFLLENGFKGVGVKRGRFLERYPDEIDIEDGYLFQWRSEIS